MFPELDKKTKNNSLILLFACYFLYLMSICIKMVYSAEMSEIIIDLESNKPSVSLGLLFYYLAYSVGQLVFSFIISKINLKWFITVCVSLTSLSFAMMLFASENWHLYLILFLNGFLQVGIWGGIMFFVGRYIPAKMSGFASKLLATGLALGTAFTYGTSALLIAFANWRYTFLFFSALSLISLIVFLLALTRAECNLGFVFAEKLSSVKAEKSEESISEQKIAQSIVSTVVFFSALTMLICCIYYGVMGWFPNLLIENFAMPTKYSILITLLLPLCTTPSSFVIITLNEKAKSDYSILILFAAAVSGLCLLLYFVYAINIVLTVVCTVLALFALRGMMSLVGVFFPLKYKDKIESGKFSLIINSFAALAAGVMPYTISFVLERTGWGIYFAILLAVALIALAMLIFARVFEKNK